MLYIADPDLHQDPFDIQINTCSLNLLATLPQDLCHYHVNYSLKSSRLSSSDGVLLPHF